jgi:hypothetical protein
LAFDLFPFNQPAEDPALLLLPLVLEEELSGEDGILGLAVELDDLELEGLADESLRVSDHFNVGMGVGQEGIDPRLDQIAVLGFFGDPAGYEALGVKGSFQIIESPEGIGPRFGQDEVAFLDIRSLENRFDLITRTQLLDILLGKFLYRDDALGLEPDVQENTGGCRLDHLALDDLAGRNFLGAELVLVKQVFVVLGDLFLPVRRFLWLCHG